MRTAFDNTANSAAAKLDAILPLPCCDAATGLAPSTIKHQSIDQQSNSHQSVDQLATVIIEKRPLVRDCVMRSLGQGPLGSVIAFSSVEAWLEVYRQKSAALVVLCSSSGRREVELKEVEQLCTSPENTAPLMVLSDFGDLDHIIAVLALGARGFLTTDVGLSIAMEAMRFVRAGGIFVPATSLLEKRSALGASEQPPPAEQGIFTARQIAVMKALRQGKANKIIAYELNMCESTVKVHVRNIMKKLKAKNRTHAAFIVTEMLSEASTRQ